MSKIRFLKLLDSLLGTLLIRVAPVPKRFPFGQHAARRVLFVRPGGIGDAVLLLPAIDALKIALPDCSIDVLAEKRNAAVFSFCRNIANVLVYDKPSDLLSVFHRSYDVVIDTEQWHRLSALVARLIAAPLTIGFATNERQKMLTHPIPYSHEDYEVFSFFRLLSPLTEIPAFDPTRPFIDISPSHLATAKALMHVFGDCQVIAVFPGGSIPERRWGGDRFQQTVKKLSTLGYGIVVVGGKSDAGEGEKIVSGIPRSLNLCGKLLLAETAAILKKSALLITGDSGIMHIGYGLGMKIVALFGPGREKKWAPRSSNVKVINKGLDCSPCTTFGYTAKCKINAECMRSITVEEVIGASLALLNTTG
jgi:ADP-heptose:LPS heptosyltransferase